MELNLESVKSLGAQLRAEVHKVVIGQDEVIDLMLLALMSEGHVLIEGVPGTAKTLLARAFSAALTLAYGRIQFTPDLMPGDVIGTNLFNFQTNQFVLTKGPIFTELLLADEINRTPPKTQAALLQAMQERAVTIDGVTHNLGGGFMVIATQEPHRAGRHLPLARGAAGSLSLQGADFLPERRGRKADGAPARPPHRDARRIAELGVVAVADLDACSPRCAGWSRRSACPTR